MEKVTLELNVSEEAELRELVFNPEVYGEALLKLISHMERSSFFPYFIYEDEDFILKA